MNEEFYVGYISKAPPGLARLISFAVGGILLASAAVGLSLVLDQPPFAQSRFEYGVYRDYEGTIEEWPHPMIITSEATFLLVAPGKHGLSVKEFRGKNAHLRGSLIERGKDRMLEVDPGSIQLRGARPVSIRREQDLGHVTLRGEIVDTKCYMGVMNPGERKVHRDCAVRCISGGLPPALVARDAAGDSRILLLVGGDGRRLQRELLPFAAEPLEVSGMLARSGGYLILKTEPSRFRRVSE